MAATSNAYSSPANNTTDQLRLLVVDDDIDAGDALSEVLARRGHGVQTANNSKGALEALLASNPDIALVDVRLGHENGIELVDQFKQNRPQLPCIMMTAYADLNAAIGAVRHGAHDFLRKPIDMDLLEAALERCRTMVRLTQEKKQAEEALQKTLDNLEQRVDERTDALRESEIRFRDFADIAADWLWEIGPDLRFTFLAGQVERAMGMRPEEFIGLTRAELYRDSQNLESPEWKEHTKALEAREPFTDYEITWPKPDGEIRNINLTGNPRFDDDGTFLGYRGVGRDTTERKKVDRLKSEFVATVSHELRTPLTSIRGSLGLLHSESFGPLTEGGKDLIEIALNNSERLINLVNDILDVEKLQSGELEFDFQTLDLSELVTEVTKINVGFADKFNTRFVLDLASPSTRVQGDANRLTQVIANLLSNAAKFSPEGSEVKISVTQNGDMAKVSVSDSGPGIPDEFRKHLFQRFSQVDSSDVRQKGGTGLGLNISRSIIERHNGEIDFESEVNVGSTFFFTLPVSG